jgi:isopenicillin N synthase-like dioxygenase
MPVHALSVPVIDISELMRGGEATQVVAELGRALEEWGFFQVSLRACEHVFVPKLVSECISQFICSQCSLM